MKSFEDRQRWWPEKERDFKQKSTKTRLKIIVQNYHTTQRVYSVCVAS